MQVNVHEAKTNLSRLLKKVSEGEEIIICRSGKPVARLVPHKIKPSKRVPGSAGNRLHIAADFDSPLPEEILKEFENESFN